MIERISEYSQHTLRQMANLLAGAFHNDPLFRHALPDAARRLSRLPGLCGLTLQYGLRFGEVYAEAQKGLAIWLPPGGHKISIPRALQAGMWRTPFKVGLQAVARLGTLNSLSEKLHNRFAPDPHWYLFMLGVEPAFQGMGLGGRLLQPVLARADEAKLPVYLETNNPKAVPFYEKHGFTLTAEQQTPVNGLVLWAMRRESR